MPLLSDSSVAPLVVCECLLRTPPNCTALVTFKLVQSKMPPKYKLRIQLIEAASRKSSSVLKNKTEEKERHKKEMIRRRVQKHREKVKGTED